MAGMSRRSVTRLVTAGLLLAAALLCVTGGADAVFRVCGLGRLTRANEQYLTRSFDRTVRTFGVLSAAKVTLALVKSTEVGVGFGVRVGDVAQAAYDYVDIAWRTVLAAGVVLLGTRYLLQAAGLVDHWLLAAAFAAGLAGVLLVWYGHRLAGLGSAARDLAVLLGACAAALYIALPVSVGAGAWLSHRTTAESLAEAEGGFAQLTADLSATQESDTGLWSKLTDAAERVKAVAAWLGDSARQLSVSTLRLVAAYVFDCLVFPLALLAVLLLGARAGGRYMMARLQARSFLRDIEAAFERSLARLSPPR